ncbi:MAG TPA: thioesterase family protein [Myxococcota bacterium]|nr:thioesterase family protein [Myxococcota bacterium]
MPAPEFVFAPDGDGFVPTELARGPWYPNTQHGSPMLGLLARAVERVPAERESQITRLTVDLMRAAPLARVETRARVVRSGGSVDVLEAELCAGGEVFARASALRFRVATVRVPEELSPERPPALPATAMRFPWSDSRGDAENPLQRVLEMRPVPGFESPTAWLRLRVPLVAGEANSPLVRVAFVSDMTYSVPLMRMASRDMKGMAARPFVAINPDTTLNLHRPALGEWICLDARATYVDNGSGTAHARLLDERGPIGHSSQSLLVRGLEARPESWKKYGER